MFIIILLSLAVITMLVGITELIRRFWLYIITPKDAPKQMLMVFLKGDTAIQQLRAASEYISWEGPNTFYGIAAIDLGLSDDTKKQVKKLVNSRSDMIFGKEDIEQFIKDFN